MNNKINNEKNKSKIRLLTLFLSLIILISFSEAYLSFPSSSYVKIRTADDFNTTYISQKFVNQNPDPAEPGGYVELRWRIENLGEENAENVTFEILPEYPFTLVQGEKAVQNIGNLHAGQVDDNSVILYYKLKVDENAVEGNNKIKLRYKINNGEWITTDDFLVRIQPHDAILTINDVTQTPDKFISGGKGKIIITLKNDANIILKDLSVKILTDDTPFTTINSINEKTIKLLKQGEEKSVSFQLMTDIDSESDVYKLPVEISYKDRLGNEYSKDGSVAVLVYNTPELIINLDDSNIKISGDRGKIFISISNIGTSKIKFLTTKLNPTRDYDILSSDTVYVGNLDSDDFETVEYEIYVKNTTKKLIPLNFSVTYKDEFNKEQSFNANNLNLRLFSKQEAIMLGITKTSTFQGPAGKAINIVIVLLVLAFMIFMLEDCVKNKMPIHKKIIWIILILTGIGALLYYFIARKSN